MFIFAAAMYTPAGKIKHLLHSRCAEQLKLISYMARNTDKDDLVIDERMRFNIFRKDAGYFWYLPRLREDYYKIKEGKYGGFDMCRLIEEKKPAVVAEDYFDFSKCGAFENYRESEYKGYYFLNTNP